MTQDFKNLKKNSDIFVLLVTFEILSYYPNIDSSLWLKEDILWITDKIFREKFLVKMVSAEFLVFACFFVVFIAMRLIVMSY